MDIPPRANLSPLYRYRFAEAEFDEARCELRVRGTPVDVQRRPLEVLAVLLRRVGEVVTRQELQELVWSNRPTVENVIDTAISKLRAVLGEPSGDRIVTQPRVGYRLTGPVERISVGQHYAGLLALGKGDSVPAREHFILDRRLGQSEHHEVWLAKHAKTGEPRVYKFSADGDGLAALKREATLSRVLRESLGERADFVRVIDWNFDAPPFYLESEYGGENLQEWGATALLVVPPAERLELFIRIADAVAAAHSVGVLHKDLKPTNLLIAGGPGNWQIRVTDFGSARLLEPERLQALGITHLGMTLTQNVVSDVKAATPLYVAPERLAGGAATAQSDVFALGILLYQLLIADLRKTLASGWEREVTDELIREDIASATDGNPAVRLASAAELANRLRQLASRRTERTRQRLAEQQAHRDHEILRQARARRPWLVATFVTLCLGLVAVLVLYGRVRDTQRGLARQYAVASALNRFLTADFIAAANPTLTGRKDITVIEATKKAAAQIDSVFSGVDPQVRGNLHAAMQQAFADLSDFEGSISEGRKALQALNAANPRDPARIVEVRARLAASLSESSRLVEASAELDSAATLIKSVHLEHSAVAARYWWARGGIEATRMSLPSAMEYDQRAWDLAKTSPDLPPEVKDSMQFSYSDMLRMVSRFDASEREARELMERQRAQLGADHPQTCWTAVLLASDLGYERRLAEGIELERHAASCLLDSLGSSNVRVGSAFQVLADLQFQAERYADAAQAYAEAATKFTLVLGSQSQRPIVARMNAGVSRQYAGQAVQAETELSAALDSARTVLGWSNPTSQNIRYHLADCRLDQHHTAGVEELLDGLSPVSLNEAQIESDWEGRLAYQRGRLALYGGDLDQAAQWLAKSAKLIGTDGRVTEATVQKLIQAVNERRQVAANSHRIALHGRTAPEAVHQP